jgi:hypothetical protein
MLIEVKFTCIAGDFIGGQPVDHGGEAVDVRGFVVLRVQYIYQTSLIPTKSHLKNPCF